MVAVPFLNPGELVGGKYAITRVIGSGGMAIVYEAVHVRLDQRVALKMLLPDLLDRDDIVTRFDREARAAVRLRSPHVARVYDVDALPDGTPYMVMELLDGRDLAAELALRGPLPVADAVDYVRQACEAMAEAHRQGTVHRDLKPSNLFLTQEAGRDFVKVLDFGVSKIAAERLELSVTSTRSALGTALYMSPEQVRSAKNVDPRTDVWSLGVVLYELLSGRAPFSGESTTAVAAAIVADEPEPIGKVRVGLPRELERVVMRSLEKDREKRFADAGAFAVALASFQGRADGDVVVGAERESRGFEGVEAAAPPPTDNSRPSTAATMHSADRVGAAIRADHAHPDARPTPPGEPAPALVGLSAGANDGSARPVASAHLSTTDRTELPARRTRARGIAIAAGTLAFLGAATVVVPQLAQRGLEGAPGSESDPGSTSAAVLVGVLPSTPQAKSEPEAGPALVEETPAVVTAPPTLAASAPPARPAPAPAKPRSDSASARLAVSPRTAPGNRAARPTPTTAAPVATSASPPLDMPHPQPAPAKSPPKKHNVDLPDTPG